MTDAADLRGRIDPIARIEIVRRDQFRSSAWRNGGGVTHEAVRRPAAGERFDWRVSVAEIATSGPFSAFDGYLRHMLLLQGNGVDLAFPDGRALRLARQGDLICFAGAPPPDCRLTSGACVDLNLITAAAIPVETWIVRDARSLAVPVDGGDVLLVFGLDAAGLIEAAPSPRVTVGRSDLAIADVLRAGEIRVRAHGHAPDAPALFLAKLAPSKGG